LIDAVIITHAADHHFQDVIHVACQTVKFNYFRLPPLFAALDKLIGKTPLISVTLKDKGTLRTIYAKLEYFNLSGSIKDRMALEVLRCAYTSGALGKGDMIVEATSGNAGIAFCAIGRALGHPVRIYMPDWMSAERIALMKSYGADVRLVVAGVGTGGTVMGVGKALRRADSKTKIHPMEPAESPTLTTGYKVGKHRIQGVSDEFIPDIR